VLTTVLAMMLLVFLMDPLSKSAPMATENPALSFLSFAIEATLAFLPFELSPLRRWGVIAALLCTRPASVGQRLIPSVFLAVLLTIDEVPALGKVRPKILYDRSGQRQGHVRPTHSRVLCPVKLVVLPVGHVLEICGYIRMINKLTSFVLISTQNKKGFHRD
jgi:hypothetical protein